MSESEHWAIVAFKHPEQGKSLLYRQKILGKEALLRAVEKAYDLGANLMSIRAYKRTE